MKNCNSKSITLKNAKTVCLKVSENFCSHLDNHVRKLKYLDKTSLKKKDWIMEAILEKLQNEKEVSFGDIPRIKHIVLKLDANLYNELDQRIELIRGLGRSSFSKKQWIVEAIQEKLAREEVKTEVIKEKIQFSSKKLNSLVKKEVESNFLLLFFCNFKRNLYEEYIQAYRVVDVLCLCIAC